MDPALNQNEMLVNELRSTRDINKRSELLVQLSGLNTHKQAEVYRNSTSGECPVYHEARRRGVRLPRDCEKYDCNGLRNPCPKTFAI